MHNFTISCVWKTRAILVRWVYLDNILNASFVVKNFWIRINWKVTAINPVATSPQSHKWIDCWREQKMRRQPRIKLLLCQRIFKELPRPHSPLNNTRSHEGSTGKMNDFYLLPICLQHIFSVDVLCVGEERNVWHIQYCKIKIMDIFGVRSISMLGRIFLTGVWKSWPDDERWRWVDD